MKIQVNGSTYDVELAGKSAVVNGATFVVAVAGEEITIDGVKYYLDYLAEGDPALVIVNGMSYLVSKSSSEGEMAKELKAPMGGQVVDIAVAEGTEVKRGQLLLTIEAMKMENQIKSPSDGRVKEVRARKGQLAVAGEILVTFY